MSCQNPKQNLRLLPTVIRLCISAPPTMFLILLESPLFPRTPDLHLLPYLSHSISYVAPLLLMLVMYTC